MGAMGGVSVTVTLSIGLAKFPEPGSGGTLHTAPPISTATATLLFSTSNLGTQNLVTVRLESKPTCRHVDETGPAFNTFSPPGWTAAVTDAVLVGGFGVDGPGVSENVAVKVWDAPGASEASVCVAL